MSEPLSRRELLSRGGAVAALLACGVLGPREASAAMAVPGFSATSLQDALHSIGSEPVGSELVSLAIPDVVDNGAFVPVAIESKLPATTEIFVLVESNPYPLVAHFAIPAGTEAFVSARVKLAGSCRVLAVVRAGGKLYSMSRETRVTVGGCG